MRYGTILMGAVLLAGQALAASIPAATYAGLAWGGGANPQLHLTAPGTADAGWGSTSISGSPSVEVLGTVDSAHRFFLGNATLDYYFGITGPGATAPVDISGHVLNQFGGGTAISSNNVDARLSLFAGDELIDQRCFQNFSACAPGPGEFAGTMHEVLSTNTIYRIELWVRVQGSWSFGAATTGHALVDGVQIGLGAVEGDPQAYSLSVSDGISNSSTSATPEPTTLLLAAAALVVVLLRARP